MAALAQAAPFSLLSFWNLQANEPIGHLKKLEKGSHIPVLGLRALSMHELDFSLDLSPWAVHGHTWRS